MKAIAEKDHTIIFLAFCYTNRSVLNDILRSSGLYTRLIMSEDRAMITNGQYFYLDKHQNNFIATIAKGTSINYSNFGGVVGHLLHEK